MKMPRWHEVSFLETFLRLLKEIKPKKENSATILYKNAQLHIKDVCTWPPFL